MTPTVLEILAHRMADRLWNRWFSGRHLSPWAVQNTPPASRLEQIRRRRARVLAELIWALLRPLLPTLARLTAWLACRRLGRQLSAPPCPSGKSVAIGNWVAGGGGKTPLCIALALALRGRGLSPAILSRGYQSGAKAGGVTAGGLAAAAGLQRFDGRVRVLRPDALRSLSPAAVGDEAWLMAWRTGCPVGVAADRSAAARAVLDLYPEINVWILDDGLSQTSMRPDHRLLVLDARGHGTGRPMPDGPLRGPWPPPQGHAPDTIVAPPALDLSGITAGLPGPPPECLARDTRPAQWLRFPWVPVDDAARIDEATGLAPDVLALADGPGLSSLSEQGPFLALAGIAQPEVFFQTLRDLGLPLIDTVRLADHAPEILPALLRWKAGHPLRPTPSLVMTEKDAVKFAWELRQAGHGADRRENSLALFGSEFPGWWALRLESRLPEAWISTMVHRLTRPPAAH